MRAGELRHRAEILELGPDLCSAVVSGVWLGIKAKEAADPPMATGLRSPARVDIRARHSAKLVQGRYLRHGDRLFYITSVRDPVGDKSELRITADELVGSPAVYMTQGQPSRECRALVQHEAPWLDDMGAVTDYKTRAEVAVIEAGRPQAGDQISIDSTLYNVIAYADATDDGVVRGLWLERV